MDFGAVQGSYGQGLGGNGAAAAGQAPQDYDPAEQQKLITRLNGIDKKLAKWAGWRTDARECRDMTVGNQWPQEALDELELEDPTASPASFNYVDPMVSAISGAEITNRQQVKYAPRRVGNVQANELLGGAADWARDECDAGDEESQAFRDTLITGFGCTETRMDYDDDPQGVMLVDRIDCVADRMEVDLSRAKPNYSAAQFCKRTRRYDKEEADVLFPDLMASSYGNGESDLGPHLNDPQTRYDPDRSEGAKGGEDACPEGMVEVQEYQWYELERVTLVVDPQSNQVLTLTQGQVQHLLSGGVNIQTMTQSASIRRKKWRRCFRADGRTRCADLPDGEFTYKFITGKIDDATGLPYGVVKAMIDPQRWSNKFMLQMDRIFASNAKGGVMIEEDAVEDWDEFEGSWAKRDKYTKVAPGALGAGKIMPKQGAPFPAIADRLLSIAANAVSQVTGVNKEMLGMAERDQAGVLEYQRKQAAYGVLAQFFDSLKRYRKQQGRLALKYIRKYMSDGRLVRINKGDGLEEYVPLVRDPDTSRYDVIVDEAPAGPNQVERTWQTFVQGAPLIQSLIAAQVPIDVIFTILKYSPFPSSFLSDLRQAYAAASQNGQQNPQAQLQLAGQQATIGKLQGEAALAHARAQRETAEAQTAPMRAQTDLQTAAAKAQLAAAQAQAAWIESMLKPQSHQADTQLTQARAHNVAVDTQLKPEKLILDARDQSMNWSQALMAHQNDLMKFHHTNAMRLEAPSPFGGGGIR